MRRALLAAMIGGLVLVTGCTPVGSPSPTAPPASAPPASAPNTPTPMPSAQEAAMRTKLAQALSASPSMLSLVNDEKTRFTELPAPWLTGWTVVDALNRTPPHPRRATIALSDDGVAKVLSGFPDRFPDVVRGHAKADTPDVAASIAAAYLDWTNGYQKLTYRVQSAADIRWKPTMSASDQSARDAFLAGQGKSIGAPSPTQSAGGWALTLWTIANTDLVKHDMVVGADGTVTDTTTVAAGGLPLPIGV